MSASSCSSSSLPPGAVAARHRDQRRSAATSGPLRNGAGSGLHAFTTRGMRSGRSRNSGGVIPKTTILPLTISLLVPPLHAFLLFAQRHGRDHIHSDVRGHGLQIAFARHRGHLLFTPCTSIPHRRLTSVAHATCFCISALCHRRNDAKLSKVIFFQKTKDNLNVFYLFLAEPLILDRARLSEI